MKCMYGIYKFNSAEQNTKTRNGFDYTLRGEKRLFKLHTPFPECLNHSWYLVIEDELVIDCYGYIEDRCLQPLVIT